MNDRFGRRSRGKHGGVYASEAGVRESGTAHKWCEDRPLSRGNWSYNRLERLEDYLSARDLVHLLVETVAQGGNLHVAISPCADGTIPMLQQERLVQLGDWLRVNGEAIYGTQPWTVSHEGPLVESVNPRLDEKWRWTEARQRPLVHYTRKGQALYALCLAKPTALLVLTAVKGMNVSTVTLVGSQDKVVWTMTDAGLRLDPPPHLLGEHAWGSPCPPAAIEANRRSR